MSPALLALLSVSQWKQDRFAIGGWVDPIVPPKRFDAEYARAAAANFTVLLGGFGATTPPTVRLQIEAARRAGLAAVPSICGGACANLTGAWGFQIIDEPKVSQFTSVAKLVAEAKELGNMAFVNLLPNYAPAAAWNASSYAEYVGQFMTEVKPNMLSVDNYPAFDSPHAGHQSKAGYIDNLLVLRQAAHSVEPPLPFWNFFRAMPYGASGSQYDVSEGELRWQAFTSLAIGATGVLYFCYWTPPGAAFRYGEAIMTPAPGAKPDIANQVPGSKYPMARRINSKLRALGDWLLARRSSAVVQVSGGRTESAIIESCAAVEGVNGTNVGDHWSFLIGLFDENRTLVLSNQDHQHAALATLTLREGARAGALHEVDPQSGTLAPALDDAPVLPGFQVSLLAGDARVFTWIPTHPPTWVDPHPVVS
jgi:hypothetical protein